MRLFSTVSFLAGLACASIFDSIQSIVKSDEPVKTLASWSYDNCGADNDAITLHSITLDPDPPVPGSPLSASISFTANKQILDGAYIKLVVKIGYITLLKKTVDLCEEDGVLKDTGISCPIEPGEHVIKKDVDLPAEIPPAKFNVDVLGFTVDDADMCCVKVFADFLTTGFGHGGL
ncbi:hypothetical protein EG329_011792 [Mollisiaceae sp. DMI_Dod_QoI]|nr:hypothetical protein EG329_011792 [Helotiales sp. DMI_Dod_QoI]